MEELYLPATIVNKETGTIYSVEHITVMNNNTKTEVNRAQLLGSFIEYVDPKDAEIARLRSIIEEMKAPPERKTRKHMSKDEWKEVMDLIRKGLGNTEIAALYDISDSSVSKRRIEMRKMGETV